MKLVSQHGQFKVYRMATGDYQVKEGRKILSHHVLAWNADNDAKKRHTDNWDEIRKTLYAFKGEIR